MAWLNGFCTSERKDEVKPKLLNKIIELDRKSGWTEKKTK